MTRGAIFTAAETVSRMNAQEPEDFVGFLGDNAAVRLRREMTHGAFAGLLDVAERRMAVRSDTAEEEA